MAKNGKPFFSSSVLNLHTCAPHRRKHRKIATTYLAPRAVDEHAHIIDLEATELVRELYIHGKAGAVPVNPQPHAGRSSLNNMLTIVFGIRTDTINHPLVARSLKISREFMYG